MKLKSSKIYLLFFALFFTSCGEIKTGIASDQLIGIYSGKATYLYKHSALNIGMNDEVKEEVGSISIFKNNAGQIFIKTGDGNLELSGITLASNGSTFNIAYQNVPQSNGKSQRIQGMQVAELNGLKFDGIYYSTSKILSFAYETVIEYNYGWSLEEVSVNCTYEFSKIL